VGVSAGGEYGGAGMREGARSGGAAGGAVGVGVLDGTQLPDVTQSSLSILIATNSGLGTDGARRARSGIGISAGMCFGFCSRHRPAGICDLACAAPNATMARDR